MSNHPLVQDEWGGHEEPDYETEPTIDNDIVELVGDEEEFLDEEDKCEM